MEKEVKIKKLKRYTFGFNKNMDFNKKYKLLSLRDDSCLVSDGRYKFRFFLKEINFKKDIIINSHSNISNCKVELLQDLTKDMKKGKICRMINGSIKGIITKKKIFKVCV